MLAAPRSHLVDGHGVVGKTVNEAAERPGIMRHRHLVRQIRRMVQPGGDGQIPRQEFPQRLIRQPAVAQVFSQLEFRDDLLEGLLVDHRGPARDRFPVVRLQSVGDDLVVR